MGPWENRRNVYFANDLITDQVTSSSEEGEHSDDVGEAPQPIRPLSRDQRSGPPPPSPLLRRRQPSRHGHKLTLKKGRRSRQRYENERELAYEAFGCSEVPTEVLEGWDIMPRPSRSQFAVLLEAENANVLCDFIEDRIETVDSAPAVKATNYGTATTEDANCNFDPEKSFLGISAALRGALKKHYHEGALMALEKEITNFFLENPRSEYVADDNLSSYERLLAHAASKYHNLQSKSFDIGSGRRKLTVENPLAEKFNPMDPTLAQYLKIRSNRD